jgi:ABC-type dipeptide/oligopeptide/nickel transport system permease component
MRVVLALRCPGVGFIARISAQPYCGGILVIIFCTLTDFSIFEIVGAHSRTQVFPKVMKNIVLPAILLATTRQDDWG